MTSMPSEIRHLLFRPPEVIQALQALHRRLGKPFAPGVVDECSIGGDGIGTEVTFHLRLHADNGSAKAQEIAVDSVTLVAALILFCREHGIPLPAKASKSLQKLNEQLCLVATYG